VREQIIQGLLTLGYELERIVVQEGGTGLGGLPAGDGAVTAILDAKGQVEETNALITMLREASDAANPRIFVLEHLLDRSSGVELGLRVEVARITEPISLQGLYEATTGRRGQAADTREERGEAAVEAPVRVLIVEDNPINLRVLQTVLRKRERFVCKAVENGQEAVDYLCRNPVDIVLMDCNMPVMDGWTATSVIREKEKAGELAPGGPPHLPIIAVTANAMEGDRKRCIDAGMDDYVAKPIKPKILFRAIEPFLSARRSDEPAPAPDKLGRILVAEDSLINQRVLKSVLEKAGYEFVLVEDGQAAVDFLVSDTCDLVLMDCQMPVLDGYDAAAEIREIEAGPGLAAGNANPIPIIACTGNATAEDRQRCLDAGMNDTITKPIQRDRLLHMIAETLSGRAAVR